MKDVKKAIRRYESAHNLMLETGFPIRHQVLRDYLDALAIQRISEPGLHDIAITIDRTSTRFITDLFGAAPADTSITLRIAGQRYDAP